MKTNIILSVVLIGTLFSSCKKKDTTAPALTYVISKDSSYTADPSQTQVRKFKYNSSKKLVEVQYKHGGSLTYFDHDSIYYNVNGQVSQVISSPIGDNANAQATNTYTYTNNLLTSVHEVGTTTINNVEIAYDRTRTFTYTGGKLSAQTVVYSADPGSIPTDKDNISNIVFTGNNMSSALIPGLASGVALTFDTSTANPYYGLNFRSDDFINLFNPNNLLKASTTAAPSKTLEDNTYTKDVNGRITKIVNNSQSPTVATAITYQSL